MNELADSQLLHAYTARRDEAAFCELVQRHTDFVYSAALRQVESSAAAADLTQHVFSDLARKSSVVLRNNQGGSLAGWLHRATRYAALNHLRAIRRRHQTERQAMEQFLANNDTSMDWEQIRPALDEALDTLGDADREALLLRYFKNQNLRAVGQHLGVSDDAAQKRVSRAVERLRDFFAKRGLSINATGLAVVISANAVQAAPAGLAVTISATALASMTVSTAAVVAATTKTIAMTTFQKALVTAAIAAVAGAGLYKARQAAQLRDQVQALQQQQAPLQEEIQQFQRERDEAVGKLAALNADNERLTRNSAELLRLRGEVGLLRKTADELRNENLHLQSRPQPISATALDPVKPPVVARVTVTRIKQPQTVEAELIHREISVKAGDFFERTSVDADVRRLHDTGWFRNIRVVEGNSSEGITLNYLLQEKPRLTQIGFSGNTRFDEESLASLVVCKAGQLLDERTIFSDAQRIQKLYQQSGFPNAKVKSVSNVNEDVGEGNLVFEIVE